MVAVISNTSMRLMPTSNYRARKLLALGKAVKAGFRPFTIRLVERTNGNTEPIECSIDTGYCHVGNSLKSAKHEYAAVEIRTLMDEKQRHNDRRMYRRTRRNRLRYRKPRFDNRKRSDGWLAPSIRHRMECNLRFLFRMIKVIPITDVTMEMGQFDTQLLKAIAEGKPVPEGADYQKGERYGIATLREAVFTRDEYTCQCCGKSVLDKVILHVHHIRYRSNGGSDSMSNLITVCDKCHTPKNHKPGGKLYNWKSKLKSFAGATFMTMVRWQMYDKVKKFFPSIRIHLTYGAKTKCNRRELDIRKSHVNDAFAIGELHPKHRARPVVLQKKRRNNRILEKFYDAKYIDLRTGKTATGQQLSSGKINRNRNTDTENLHLYRKQKISKGRRSIRKTRYKIQPNDIVMYKGKLAETKGCQNLGTYLLIGKNTVSIKQVKLKRYAGAYYLVAEKEEAREAR